MGLLDKLSKGENLVVAEGYLFEFERRCRLKAGAFVPDVSVHRPDLVKSLYEEFVYAGSDVVLAFTYYAHREKLRLVGKENDLEKINRTALTLAREVADDTGTLMAGNICNTTVYDRSIPETVAQAANIFKEQVEWAAQEKADFIVGETFGTLGEAMLALEAIKKYGNGLPAVITLVPRAEDVTDDDVDLVEACQRLEEEGAAVVGLNCCRGPETMLPTLRKIRQACKGPIAALPVVYRTRPSHPTMQSLVDPDTDKKNKDIRNVEKSLLPSLNRGAQFWGCSASSSSNDVSASIQLPTFCVQDN
ncbi:betaine--homocysteine S-methyltransferase 1-like isoform X2 [Liolophura sinensis]|uniref:betaine--homocysteine S-methyltransferase 1-like isoform X2 n=1 Tax=Liolophura sinensis TaxID=3198878 RepID=UPI0031584BCF